MDEDKICRIAIPARTVLRRDSDFLPLASRDNPANSDIALVRRASQRFSARSIQNLELRFAWISPKQRATRSRALKIPSEISSAAK